jgi:hypothetical protein
MSTGTYFSLNPIGTEFWNMLDGGQTVEQHAQAIAGKYNTKVGALASELQGLAAGILAEPSAPSNAAGELRALAAGIPEKYQVADPPVVNDLLDTAKAIDENRQADSETTANLVRGLADSVARKYHVDEARVLDDLMGLANEMLAARLVNPV